MTDLFVTKHAIDRYLEREEGYVADLIKTIVREGEQIYPKTTQQAAILLMNHQYKNTSYFFHKGLIAVVVDKRVVTTLRRVKNMFTSEKPVEECAYDR